MQGPNEISERTLKVVKCFTNAVSLVSLEISTWEQAEGRMFSFLPISLCWGTLWTQKCCKPLFGRQNAFFWWNWKGQVAYCFPTSQNLNFLPLYSFLCVLIICNFIEAHCASPKRVSREKNLPRRAVPEWKFVNNKNAIFVFQNSVTDFFSTVKIYWLVIWY